MSRAIVFSHYVNSVKEKPKMELKATLKEYTAPEFLALVDRIWAVDLPRQDHDDLINHFDQIVGHPRGADLLFYPDDSFGWHQPGFVVHHVRNWHHKRGMAAFKGEVFPVSTEPAAPLSAIARNLADLQKISTDVTASENVLGAALDHLEKGINQHRSQERIHASVAELETRIRTLEHARDGAHTALRKFEFWKMGMEFIVSGTQRTLSYARSDQKQWQSQMRQITAVHDRYRARLASTAQRFRTLHDEAEALLIAAQEQLIRSRNMAGVGPARAACVITASLAFAGKRPDILLGTGPSALFPSQQTDLQKAIRSAVAEFTWQNTAATSVDEYQYAAVLQFLFTSRADTQVYGFSVPLAEFVVLEGPNWQLLAANRGEIDVPFRMGSAIVAARPRTMFQGVREVKSLSQVYITPFQGRGPIPKVRVRAALRDEQSNGFSFTADGAAPITVSWSAPALPEVGSPMGRMSANRLGFVHSPAVPLLEPLIDDEEPRFDDYIVVFPVESGLDPLYVMFRDRREYPV